MNVHVCSVCGSVKADNENWFLLSENRWRDRLNITLWSENAANFGATYHACRPDHVREFLHTWVTSGELPTPQETSRHVLLESTHAELPSIGHLFIHRHSLKDTHEGLKSILDVIEGVLKTEFSDAAEATLPPKIQPPRISLQSYGARAS